MKKTVMVVEDDQDIRNIIEKLLSEEHYLVKLYPNLSSFKSEIGLNAPDLLITDVMLPDGNGLELCQEIKTNSRTVNYRY